MNKLWNHRPTGRKVGATTFAAGLIVAGLGVTAPSAGASTAKVTLPKVCPSKSVVGASLSENVTKVNSKTEPTPYGKAKLCAYKAGSEAVTAIGFGSPVSHAEFAHLRTSEKKNGRVVVVHGLGDGAWATRQGDVLLLSVLKGTTDLIIGAPRTEHQLEGLARTLLKALPAS